MPRRDDVRRLGQRRTTRTRCGSSTGALDAGDQLHRHRRRLLARRVRGDRRPRARRGRRDDVVLATKFHGAMGEDPNQRGNSRRWIIREVEESLRRLRTDWIDLYQVHRPDADTDIEETLSALTRPRPRRQGPLHRQLDVPGLADRRGAVGRRASAGSSASRPSSRRTRSSSAASRPTCCRPAQRHGIAVHPVEPARRRLAVGRLPQGRRAAAVAARRPPRRAATTSPSPTTSASSTPPTRSPCSPRRPACR